MNIRFVIELIGTLPLVLFVAIVGLKARQIRKQERRDPITTDLRHLPGASLQQQLDALYDSRMDRVVWALASGVMCALVIATRKIAMNSLLDAGGQRALHCRHRRSNAQFD